MEPSFKFNCFDLKVIVLGNINQMLKKLASYLVLTQSAFVGLILKVIVKPPSFFTKAD